MPNIGVSKALFLREVRDYVMIFIAMMSYCIGWTVFLLPNNITTGGVAGIASIVYWAVPFRDACGHHKAGHVIHQKNT